MTIQNGAKVFIKNRKTASRQSDRLHCRVSHTRQINSLFRTIVTARLNQRRGIDIKYPI